MLSQAYYHFTSKIAILSFSVLLCANCSGENAVSQEAERLYTSGEALVDFNTLISIPSPLSSSLGNEDPCALHLEYSSFLNFTRPNTPGAPLIVFRDAMFYMYQGLCYLKKIREFAGEDFLLREDYVKQRREELLEETVNHLQSGNFENSKNALQRLGILGSVGEIRRSLLRDYIRAPGLFSRDERRRLVRISNLYNTESIARGLLLYSSVPVFGHDGREYEDLFPGVSREGVASWAGNNRMYLISKNALRDADTNQVIPDRFLFRRQRVGGVGEGGYRIDIYYDYDWEGASFIRRSEIIRRKDANGNYYLIFRSSREDGSDFKSSSGIVRKIDAAHSRLVQYYFEKRPSAETHYQYYMKQNSYKIRYNGEGEIESVTTELQLCTHDGADGDGRTLLPKTAAETEIRDRTITGRALGAHCDARIDGGNVGDADNKPYAPSFVSNDLGDLKARLPISHVYSSEEEEDILRDSAFDFSPFAAKIQEAKNNRSSYPITDSSVEFGNLVDLLIVNH